MINTDRDIVTADVSVGFLQAICDELVIVW